MFRSDLVDVGQPVALVFIGWALSSIDQRPCLSPIGPVVRMEAMRLTEMMHGIFRSVSSLEMMRELEMCCRERNFKGPWSRAPDDFILSEDVCAISAIGDPVANELHVSLPVDPDLPRRGQRFGSVWIEVFRRLEFEKVDDRASRRKCWLGGPNYRARFIDPNARRNVDDSE